MGELNQDCKTIVFASHGTQIAIQCLSSLMKSKLLKLFKFQLVLHHDAAEKVYATESLLREIDKRLFICQTDTQCQDSIRKSLNTIFDTHKKIEALVCYFDERPVPKPTCKLSADDVKEYYSNNLYPNMLLISEAIKKMRDRCYGKIISINPIAAINGVTYYPGYTAVRFALQGYLESAAAELMLENICIISLVIAMEKKPEVYRALDRASSFHGQSTGDISINNVLECLEADENKLIKEHLMKEINIRKLSNLTTNLILTTKKSFLNYMNKACQQKATQILANSTGLRITQEVSKFFICTESDLDGTNLSTINT